MKNDDYHDLEEHKRYIDNAYNKTQQLKNLIDDLFEYTRLTSGTANLSIKTKDLNGLLDTQFEPIAEENSLIIQKNGEHKPILGRIDAEKFGQPITREQEQLLFERFYKGDPSRNDHHMPSCAGLGLSIAKNIVVLHNGRMGLNHHNGHFTFYIELPLVPK